MTRLAEDIPPDEDLFRQLLKGDWDGDRVKETAIDVRGGACSFSRSKYCMDPAALLKGTWIGVGVLRAGDVPAELMVTAGGNEWRFQLVDDPKPNNEAHCEVRYRKTGSRNPLGDRPKNKMRLRIRQALSAPMRVRLPVPAASAFAKV